MLQQIPDHVRKDLSEENPDLRERFCMPRFHLHLFFQNNFLNNVQTKILPAESDLPRQTLLRRGLRSF